MKENQKEDKNPSSIIQYYVTGNQVNICHGNGNVNATQNNPIEKSIVINNTIKENRYKYSKPDNGLEGILTVVILLALSIFIDYRYQIRGILCLITAIIEMTTLTIFFSGKKNKILCDSNIKKIIYFNLIAVLLILILMGMINSSLYDNVFKFSTLEMQIHSSGIIYAIMNSKEFYYALFQVVGVIFAGSFLIFYVITSNLYVIAVLSIVMERRHQGMWNFLLKKTSRNIKDGNMYIRNGIIWLVLIISFASGLCAFLIGLIQQNAMQN